MLVCAEPRRPLKLTSNERKQARHELADSLEEWNVLLAACADRGEEAHARSNVHAPLKVVIALRKTIVFAAVNGDTLLQAPKALHRALHSLR